MKTKTELEEIFDNNFSCYSKHKVDGLRELAMTKDRFVEVVTNILASTEQRPLAKNKQNMEDCFRSFIRSKFLSKEWELHLKQWERIYGAI